MLITQIKTEQINSARASVQGTDCYGITSTTQKSAYGSMNQNLLNMSKRQSRPDRKAIKMIFMKPKVRKLRVAYYFIVI
jgi:hypothetical protein